MKKNFMTSIQTTNGACVQKGVLASDSATEPAIIVAIRAALAFGGAGSEVLNISKMGQVDIDATGN
jgi:hypothetical protein